VCATGTELRGAREPGHQRSHRGRLGRFVKPVAV
jgi:hypothetical protein